MALEFLSQEPVEFTAGDTVKWEKSFSDYPPASWALEYRLIGSDDGITEITAAEVGTKYQITIPKADSATLIGGNYTLVGYVSDGSERLTVYSGQVTVKANLEEKGSAFDTRTHARKTLDAIEAVIENRASKDQQSYSIAGRSLSRMTIDDLLKFRSQYKAEVKQEVAAERVAAGLGSGRKIGVRF